MGVIPVENSLTGSIHKNYDLLLKHDLKIVGEITLRIVHNLIGPQGAEISQIRRIYSHPEVFEQCKLFLETHPEWDLVALQDTASSVIRIKENQDPAEAAIASKEAADLFKMSILKEGIETNPRNFTRFVIISKEEFLKGPKNKSSLIYSVSDKPGSLYETLKIFADNQINIVKLESRPIHSKPWEYMFYVDIELDIQDEKYKNVLELLEDKTEFFKILGNYRKELQSAN